jgi:hypothetical protein
MQLLIRQFLSQNVKGFGFSVKYALLYDEDI